MSIRIVHVIDGLGSGGAERLLTIYATELHRKGHDVHIVVLNDRNGNPERTNIEAAGIPTSLIPVGKLRNFCQIWRFFSELKALKPDIVHAHLQFSSILCSLFGRFNGVPSVATVHTLEGPELANRDGLRRWLMYKTLATFCDRVICLSNAAEAFARANGLAGAQIDVLPNGIDLSAFERTSASERRDLRSALGIPEHAPLIISVAVLRPPKGMDRLIRAMPAICKGVDGARLLIVGDGPERERLVALAAELGVADSITFTGQRPDVPALMSLADVFVLPTLDDAQPTVVMEAMASRLPVIATTVGGLPDMIEHSVDGVLVPPDDVAALEAAVSEMLTDFTKRAEFAAAGRATVEEKFSLDRQVARLTELYETLLREAKRR